MAESFSSKHEYLQALRRGDVSLIKVRPDLSRNAAEDFTRFRKFLEDNGHSNPTPNDLYLVIERKEVIKTLTYAADRNCLGFQYCFGFNKPVNMGGRFLLVTKGVMVDRPCEEDCDDEIYDTDFQVRDADSPNWYKQHFLNFRLNHELPPDIAKAYVKNFNAIYTTYASCSKDHLRGSVLSVKRLLSILTDAGTVLGTTKFLTFRWGITGCKKKELGKPNLGNFTLVIGTGDVSRGPVIERRTDKEFIDEHGDCPPRQPCEEN